MTTSARRTTHEFETEAAEKVMGVPRPRNLIACKPFPFRSIFRTLASLAWPDGLNSDEDRRWQT